MNITILVAAVVAVVQVLMVEVGWDHTAASPSTLNYVGPGLGEAEQREEQLLYYCCLY